MKRDLLDILACPACKGPLELRVEAEERDQVLSGSLVCTRCGETYPIQEGIPNLLPRSSRP